MRLQRNQEQLKKLAMLDSLTILYNHALIIELLEKELAKQQRKNGSIAFVMLDIDHFKTINDMYGHTSGDSVLQELASILKSSVREGDFAGRYGGEEFSVILPEVDKKQVWEICERIRKEIEEHAFHIENGKSIHLTVSIGVCHTDCREGLTGKEIIKKSDRELYRAKGKGRTRVEMNSNL